MSEYNEDKIIKKLVKKDFNKLGLTILMNMLIANAVIFISVIFISAINLLKNPNMSSDFINEILKNGNYSGSMSIIAVVIAFSVFVVYRGKKFFIYDLRVKNRSFNLKTVIVGSIILLSLNSLLGVFSNFLELGLNAIGFTANHALEELETLNEFAIPMIIYTCIVAPIFEEFIYRGVILRSLEKYGKRFAIIISALLFGLMHGNFYQIFMAVGVGIILGYLAIEYSIKLTILLHIINNVSVQILSQISSSSGSNIANIIDSTFSVLSILVLVIALVRKGSSVKVWLQNNKIEKGVMTNFFTSILIILVVVIDIISVISGIGKV